MYTFNPGTHGRAGDIYKFEANLVYIFSRKKQKSNKKLGMVENVYNPRKKKATPQNAKMSHFFEENPSILTRVPLVDIFRFFRSFILFFH